MGSTQELNPDYRRKRQRISRACDLCRARKVRCDERQPSCTRCVSANVSCTTTDGVGHAVSPAIRRKTDVDQNLESSQRQKREGLSLLQSSPAHEVRATFPEEEVDGKRHTTSLCLVSQMKHSTCRRKTSQPLTAGTAQRFPTSHHIVSYRQA